MIPSVLLIDHNDSFTYNLFQLLKEAGAEVEVVKFDNITVEEVQKKSPSHVVFSPGPGTVTKEGDIGNSAEIFTAFRGKIPMLGVCLGHQMMGMCLGAQVVPSEPAHGVRCPIKVLSKDGLFQSLPDHITGMRYHSLMVDRSSISQQLMITAQTDDEDQFVMGFENLDEKIFGVQFHPESIGTPEGKVMVENFLKF